MFTVVRIDAAFRTDTFGTIVAERRGSSENSELVSAEDALRTTVADSVLTQILDSFDKIADPFHFRLFQSFRLLDDSQNLFRFFRRQLLRLRK